MNLSKSLEFFNPSSVKEQIHIIGCGSVGSSVAENLVRCGITKMTLWDFDTVEPHNIGNQMFDQRHLGMLKTEALRDILTDINPDASGDIKLESKGWNGELITGYIFLAVDNIDLRREIVTKIKNSPFVKAVFDFRTLLTSAQHYAADWSSYKMKQDLLNSMRFSHEEAVAETPVSACGVTLGVATTVRLISALGVNNFINFVKGDGIRKYVMIDGFHFILDAFE